MRLVRPLVSRASRSTIALLAVVGVLLLNQPVVNTAGADALPFAKSFLLTGNYEVGSVDLSPKQASNGVVTGTIPMSGVPAGADVVAAYLYWETISSSPAELGAPLFRGQPITVVKKTSAQLNTFANPCWCWFDWPHGRTMTMYRADVLRLLPLQLDADQKPTGKLLVNDADLQSNNQPLHTVALPSRGDDWRHEHSPLSVGASLVVIYRDGSQPLTSIVMYDGLHLQPYGTSMRQTIRGFLQSSSSHAAKITHIVGSGGKNSSDRLFVNNQLVANDPIRSSDSGYFEHAWSGKTFDVTSLLPGSDPNLGYGEEITTKVDHTRDLPLDCLAWAAVIFSTGVQDGDHDGLPDKLEDVSGLKAPNGAPLPDLRGMGADSSQKDLFIEAGAMLAGAGTSYGNGDVDPDGHNHLPKPPVLKLIGDAYWNAGIRVHFDVGPWDVYHDLGAGYDSTEADGYLVPSGLARGGESIREVDCALTVPGCQFPGYPGTVSWKAGFQLYRDAPVGAYGEELSAAAMDACQETGTCVRRRFDQNRLNFFHYILYAHSRGKPKEPCLTGTADQQAECRANNPNYHVPSTSSGVGDLPGGDSLVTLGAWGHGFVGAEFVQASTTMHELGHSFWLTHGGRAVTIAEPNCKPNYLSVMNYLFQVGGLRDEDGTPHLDYSGSANGTLNELYLGGDPLDPIHLQYRTAWYAPLLPGTLPFTLGTPAATKFCNGAPFPNGQLTPYADGVPWARVDAYSATLDAIDWSAGLHTPPPQDINFDNQLSASLNGANDWADLRMDQVGSRSNMGGFSLGIDFTGFADFTGGIDFTGLVDFQSGIDFTGFTGGIDFTGFAGGIDFTGFTSGIDFTGFADGVEAELDLEIVKAMGNVPANVFKGTVTDLLTLHRVKLTWKAPDVGTVSSYSVYRVSGATVSPTSVKHKVGGADVPADVLTLIDPDELPDGQPFTYYIVSHFTDGSSSGGSNFSTIIAVNDEPVAKDAAVVTNEDTMSAPFTLGADDADSAGPLVFSIVTPPAHGTLDVSALPIVKYTPHPNYFGPDSFTFKANDLKLDWNVPGGDSLPATISITVNPVNDVPVFAKGADQTVTQGSGPKTVTPWATNISPGPANSTPEAAPPASESGQLVNFIVTNSNNALFLVQPSISPAGTLTFTPSATTSGFANVSVQIHDNGGTDYGGTDTSTIQVFKITVLPATMITSAGPADVWLGVKSGGDAGVKIDVKAEVLKNGVVIASGLVSSVAISHASSSFNTYKAVLKAISLAQTGLPTTLARNDTLSLRVSARIAASGSTKSKATVSLWYNVQCNDETNSHLHAVVGGSHVKYHLVSPFALKKSDSVSGSTKSADVCVDRNVNGNAFVTFGTWTITIQ